MNRLLIVPPRAVVRHRPHNDLLAHRACQDAKHVNEQVYYLAIGSSYTETTLLSLT